MPYRKFLFRLFITEDTAVMKRNRTPIKWSLHLLNLMLLETNLVKDIFSLFIQY